MKKLSRKGLSLTRIDKVCKDFGLTLMSEYKRCDEPLLVQDKYGLCKVTLSSLMRGSEPTIKSAIDKTSYIINKFKAVHSDVYSYVNVDYKSTKSGVEIICYMHGTFVQTPTAHLCGKGCPSCGLIRRGKLRTFSQEEFLSLASLKHDNKYTYDNFIYTYSKDKSNVTCPIHGDFSQSAYAHIAGQGCPKCATITTSNALKISQKDFENRVSKLFGPSRFKILSTYENNNTPVIISDEFGTYKIFPNNLLRGYPPSIRLAIDKSLCIKNKFKSIHGDTYDYSKVVYTDVHTDVQIICRSHGSFFQKPAAHLKGCGCPTCGNIVSSFRHLLPLSDIEASKTIPCNLYVMEFKSLLGDELFWKIGISVKPLDRLKALRMTKEYIINITYTEEDSIFDCYSKEKLLLNKMNKYKYSPKIKFGGHTECLSIDPIDLVKNIIKK